MGMNTVIHGRSTTDLKEDGTSYAVEEIKVTNGGVQVTGAVTNVTQAQFNALSLSASDAGKEYRITDGANAGNVYLWNGAAFETVQRGGAMLVDDTGPAAQPHNRYIKTIGNVIGTDIGTATWTAAEGVYAIRIKGICAATDALLVRFVFDASPVDDATDTTQAQAWLSPVTSTSTSGIDVEYFEYMANTRAATANGTWGINEWSEWYTFAEPLRRIDVLNASATDENIDIFIEVAS